MSAIEDRIAAILSTEQPEADPSNVCGVCEGTGYSNIKSSAPGRS